MIFRAIYHSLNALCLACYAAGLSAASTFLANTRIVGVRDGKIKLPAVALTVLGLPLAGLFYVLASGDLVKFLPSLFRPFSWPWVWRVGFTTLGARYLAQEIGRHM